VDRGVSVMMCICLCHRITTHTMMQIYVVTFLSHNFFRARAHCTQRCHVQASTPRGAPMTAEALAEYSVCMELGLLAVGCTRVQNWTRA
jgi:hypothetical protein